MKPFRRRTERHGWAAAGGAWMAGLWIVSAGVSFARACRTEALERLSNAKPLRKKRASYLSASRIGKR